jgi:DNA adenine methylase
VRYLGGKSRIASQIAEVIKAKHSSNTRIFEPFMGGGSVTVELAKYFSTVLSSDTHPDLIAMWSAVLTGWQPPRDITVDAYEQLRHAAPSAVRGFVGFAGSFGAKWFGGFARGNRPDGIKRNYIDESARSLHAAAARMRNVVNVSLCDYRNIKPLAGDIVYADPPYANTTGYSGPVFDSKEFWGVAALWRESGVHVYVSECSAPKYWFPVWSRTVSRTLKVDLKMAQNATESLYELNGDLI